MMSRITQKINIPPTKPRVQETSFNTQEAAQVKEFKSEEAAQVKVAGKLASAGKVKSLEPLILILVLGAIGIGLLVGLFFGVPICKKTFFNVMDSSNNSLGSVNNILGSCNNTSKNL